MSFTQSNRSTVMNIVTSSGVVADNNQVNTPRVTLTYADC